MRQGTAGAPREVKSNKGYPSEEEMTSRWRTRRKSTGARGTGIWTGGQGENWEGRERTRAVQETEHKG